MFILSFPYNKNIQVQSNKRHHYSIMKVFHIINSLSLVSQTRLKPSFRLKCMFKLF